MPKEALVEILKTPQGKELLMQMKELEKAEEKHENLPQNVHSDGINTFDPQLLGLLRERLVSMGHEPSEDELIAVANSDMGKRILSLFQQQLGVNNELEKDAVAARDAGEEDSELASNMEFIRSILKEKGMNASEEEIKKLASTERGKELVSQMKSLKTDQVSALLQIPIVKTFRQQLESQGMKLSDEHFEELLKTTPGRGALRDFIDQTTKAQEGLSLSEEQMKEMEKTEEGREVLRKYAKIKEINESLEVLRKHLDDQDEADNTDLPSNGSDADDKSFPTAADRLRTILKLRGVEMSDQEFQALLESDQGQKMLRRIQELQSEEDNEVGAVEPNQQADVEAHDGRQDLELSKKLKELRKLQGLLLSLGNRVEQATAIQDTKGKVVSEEDAAVLRKSLQISRN